MTAPTLESAREILADAASAARSRGDPVAELEGAAIEVVLAALDHRAHCLVAFGFRWFFIGNFIDNVARYPHVDDWIEVVW